MSAYIVDHDHIDALLSYAIEHRARYTALQSCVEITALNATEIGRILLDENERSVRCRYADCSPDELPGSGQESASYNFRPWSKPLQALTILKACEGFDYQACEADNYDQSIASNIIDAIRKIAIYRLPGFSDAPGWSLSRA